jgi:hypothetical protein
VQSAFVQLDVVGTAVDLRSAGVGPALAEVEAHCALVAVEDPQASLGEVAGTQAVERDGVQAGAYAAPQTSGSRLRA